ncbi:MAG TPA: HD domain-containing protein [Bacteroidales bacterium]|nr:HD domain-containing protein [Bacteroidales bacterium]
MNVFEDDKRLGRIADYVKKEICGYDSGHDWHHINRVLNVSLYIHNNEHTGDFLTIVLGALMHDVGDRKFGIGEKHDEIETILSEAGFKQSVIEAVIDINRNISFSSSDKKIEKSDELMIVQDADRLDAIGAIGIARAFNYGGFKNRVIYDPDYEPLAIGDMNAYRKSTSPTINHFYEKLLLLKDMMNTKTGRKLAEERHNFMELFLQQFYREWNLKI